MPVDVSFDKEKVDLVYPLVMSVFAAVFKYVGCTMQFFVLTLFRY